MSGDSFTESVVEEAAIDWLRGLGYQYLPGPDIACDGPYPERASYGDAVLEERPRGMVLVTAYCTDIESHCEKLRKERDTYLEMQKPPRGAT